MYIVQSVLINTDTSLKDAINWILTHNYVIKKVDLKKLFFRFRQRETPELKKLGFTKFITHKISDKIKLILAYKENHSSLDFA